MGRFGETHLLAGRGGRNLEGAITLDLVKPGLSMTEDEELGGVVVWFGDRGHV